MLVSLHCIHAVGVKEIRTDGYDWRLAAFSIAAVGMVVSTFVFTVRLFASFLTRFLSVSNFVLADSLASAGAVSVDWRSCVDVV